MSRKWNESLRGASWKALSFEASRTTEALSLTLGIFKHLLFHAQWPDPSFSLGDNWGEQKDWAWEKV